MPRREDEGDPGDYRLLDCGSQARLERFGPVILQRPSPQSLWKRRQPGMWEDAHALYHRSAEGGGQWERRREFPEPWSVEMGGVRLRLQTTGFGHVGVFPEQVPFWEWIRRSCSGRTPPPKVLNLFAYTGGASIAAAQGGAQVTHCDASRGIVQWASENARANGLLVGGGPAVQRPAGLGTIRWIVDDAARFVAREIRRQRRYDAIILDPPSFGRGPKGQVWKLETDLPGFLTELARLLSDAPLFVLLSAHTPGIGPLVLRNLLEDALGESAGRRAGGGTVGDMGDFGRGEMTIGDAEGRRLLPSGTWAAWSAEGTLPHLSPAALPAHASHRRPEESSKSKPRGHREDPR